MKMDLLRSSVYHQYILFIMSVNLTMSKSFIAVSFSITIPSSPAVLFLFNLSSANYRPDFNTSDLLIFLVVLFRRGSVLRSVSSLKHILCL